MLSTHEAWSDILLSVGRLRSTFFGIQSALHIQKSCPKLVIVVQNDFFRFLYQRLAGAELHRWETYLEHRVQAKGWDGPTLRRTLRHLPRSVPQRRRWFLLKVHLNAPIASARLVAARVVEEPVQCCFCSRSSDSLDHLPRCFTVLDVYNSIRDAANRPPTIDGRHSLMLQERWGSVQASILAFFLCHLDSPIDAPAWSPFLLIPRIEGFSAGQPPMSMVGALLSHSIPQTTTTRPGLSAIANPRSHNLQI